MLGLSISGIDLKLFALSTCFKKKEQSIIIALNVNSLDKIVLLESSSPLQLQEYNDYIVKAKETCADLFKKFKIALVKKLKLI